MSFLTGSYICLAAMALAGTSVATTPRAVDAVLAGLAECTGREGFYDRRVARGISAPGSHRTERESLPSLRSSHPKP